MIATLPPQFRNTVWFDKLKDKSFDHALDGNFLKEAAWLRDISNHARGRDPDDLAVAGSLFDWTIRNVRLIDPPSPKQPDLLREIARRLPADVLLQGEGTALQRAWVFILLGRQQKLDIVMLYVPDPDRPDRPRPWLPALLHNGQLYLFDTTLGLPIPGPGGKGVATLAEAADNPAVLDALDLDADHHYFVKAAEAKQVLAFIEASPDYLSRRMKALETELTGSEHLVLTCRPAEIARQLKGIAHVAPEIKIWTFPYESYGLRQLEHHLPRAFQERLVMEMAPFKVPGYHGSHSTVMKPGERQQALDELMQAGENPNEKRSSVVTAGKHGRNCKIVFVMNVDDASFDHYAINFIDNPAITAEHETVAIDNKNPQVPQLNFQIAEGKTTANDIIKALAANPVASRLFSAANTTDSNGEGLVDVADSTVTTRATITRPTDIKCPVRIVFPLWAGRLLQFRGDYDGEVGAKHFLMLARPGADQLVAYATELVVDFQKANKEASPAEVMLMARRFDRVVFRRKQDATFWLGLISYDEGQYDAAEDYFKMVPLEVRPDVPSPWIAAARYNLARSYEASGRTADAIKLLDTDDSAQRYGNRLLARRLQRELKPEAKKETPKAKPETKEAKKETPGAKTKAKPEAKKPTLEAKPETKPEANKPKPPGTP